MTVVQQRQPVIDTEIMVVQLNLAQPGRQDDICTGRAATSEVHCRLPHGVRERFDGFHQPAAGLPVIGGNGFGAP